MKLLKPGKHTIVFDFKYDGPGPAKGGTGVLSAGTARNWIARRCGTAIPILMSIDETMDVGLDTRSE